MTQNGTVIQINQRDNVGVLIKAAAAGEELTWDGTSIWARQEIPAFHKIALTDIDKGDEIIKYGYPIGRASQKIKLGDHIHSHNCRTGLETEQEYSYSGRPEPSPLDTSGSLSSFYGYPRSGGKWGIRNEIWILPTVGCVNNIARRIAQESQQYSSLCDGIFAFTHPYGCSQLGEDHAMTQKILAGLARHPNAGGVLILGLGCENNNIEEFKKYMGEVPPSLRFLNAQDSDNEVEEGVALVRELAQGASRVKREETSISRLTIGLKCGGSDAFSGITANPLTGLFCDRLISSGGSALLTEVPEMFGAETILMERCINTQVFNKTVSLINDFKNYFIRHRQPVYENPSPGNREGGITTLEEKSLGCIQKGGHSPVCDVLDMGDLVRERGLSLVNGPGNDIVSTTAMTAAGAQLIIFTTGRGTPLGAPVPTVKVSTNTELSLKKPGWIDCNADFITGDRSSRELLDDLTDLIASIVSGEKRTRNEENGYREIAIFKDGVTL